MVIMFFVLKNFFETAHAKGPQDAAGGFLKNQADLAVVRGKTSIKSAKDFFDFCNEKTVTTFILTRTSVMTSTSQEIDRKYSAI
jgi:hypothetical protein